MAPNLKQRQARGFVAKVEITPERAEVGQKQQAREHILVFRSPGILLTEEYQPLAPAIPPLG